MEITGSFNKVNLLKKKKKKKSFNKVNCLFSNRRNEYSGHKYG